MSTIDNVPLPQTPLPASTAPGGTFGTDGFPGLAPPRGDGVSPAVGDPSGGFGFGFPGGDPGLRSVLGNFSEFIADLFARISNAFGGGTPAGGGSGGGGAPAGGGSGGGGTPAPAEQWFSQAQASSVGDPHDAFQGTGANGRTISGRWDSMTSHPDLLRSDSFTGGFRISTDVTAPGQNGVTHNQSATVSTDDGNTRVTMSANGSVSIVSYGKTTTLAPGQSVTLKNGETVAENGDGSLSVTMDNGRGGTLAVSLRATGGGVDVNAKAANVDLGGYLVDREEGFPEAGGGGTQGGGASGGGAGTPGGGLPGGGGQGSAQAGWAGGGAAGAFVSAPMDAWTGARASSALPPALPIPAASATPAGAPTGDPALEAGVEPPLF